MKKIIFGFILALSLIVSVCYGIQKSGFHEDEYYTYYSSNRSIGLYQPDREWQDRQTILDEFAVKPGEGFNYGMVKLVQSWDVHPPLYYFIFHTLCSFVPGQFSKWPGLITNLIAFVIAFIFLCLLMEELQIPLPLEIFTLVFWGLNPQTVSCNLLIRMYAWLGAAVMACAYFHVRLIKRWDELSAETGGAKRGGAKPGTGKPGGENAGFEKPGSEGVSGYLKGLVLKGFLPIAIVSYLGFLIQYFYIFFFVCIGAVCAFWLLLKKQKIKEGFIYIGMCAASLLLAVATYPSALRHMFGGYRGTGASGSLFDMNNTWMRISFFMGLLNDFVFGGGLVVIALILFLGIAYGIGLRNKKARGILSSRYDGLSNMTGGGRSADRERENESSGGAGPKFGAASDLGSEFKFGPELAALTVGAFGYFLLTSKTALLVGAASNRYEMPVYGLLILLIFLDGYYVLSKLGNRTLLWVMGAVMLAFLFKGLINDGRVLFLYPEDREKMAYAAANSKEVAVVMFNPATPQNVWRLTDELLEYPKVFYMDEENAEKITDEEVVDSDRLILYMADDDLQKAAVDNLMDSTGLRNITWIAHEDMWNTYEVTP